MKAENLKMLFAFVVISAFISCINDDNYNNIDADCISAIPSKTIADIYDTTDTSPVQYLDDDIIEAYVTSSDEGSTFYKSISFQTLDGSLAFSIPVDMYNIYNEFEPGRKVYIQMKNRFYNITHGSLVIGDLYQETDIGRLSPEEFRRTVKASCVVEDEEEIVQKMTIPEALNNSQINKLIEIDNIQFSDEALNSTYYNPDNTIGGATNINLVDEDNNTIIFRTSEYAKFAGHKVPSGNGKVRGVLTKYYSTFQFLARTEADIQLTAARVFPIFQETFSSNFPLWTKFSVSGTQSWSLDTTHGNPGSCAKMSGFASGANRVNEDWLISPAIDLSSVNSASLSFETATKFSGEALQILISTDYSGTGNPTTSNWTALTATLSPSSGNYVWTHSGKIDISTFAGDTIYLAFKYTSTTAEAATWEVDNIKVSGN